MYDTWKLYQRKYPGLIVDRNHLASVLDNVVITENQRNPEDIRLRGKLKNLEFSENMSVINISGSIPQYLYGNNYKSITLSQTHDFIEEIL